MGSPSTSPLQDQRFLLLETLGRGGMAEVYGAFDRVDQRMVALKVQTEDERAGPSHPFSAEFDAWSRLRHPNIVRAIELSHARTGPISAGTPYIVLEHVAGRPVNEALDPGNESPETLSGVAEQVLRGLSHVHASGLVHRDLKPSNVLVELEADRTGSVKLTDFGLATPAGTSEEAGTISGSLPYISPEGLLGLPMDGRADLYGLGILLYQLATGELPLPTTSAEEAVRWHLSGPPADPQRLRLRVPARLARFITRLTQRDRDLRPADAPSALAQLGAEPPVDVAPPVAGRAERAKLRLAMDATRLGAWRTFQLLPGAQGLALLREARSWSQVQDLTYHELTTDPAHGVGELNRLVLRLLLEQGSMATALIRRHALHDALPLGLLGGHPLVDRSADLGARRGVRQAAARIARFLGRCAARRALVLRIEGPDRNDSLVAGVVRLLAAGMPRPARPSPSGRGLLLLVDRDGPSYPKKGTVPFFYRSASRASSSGQVG